MDNRIDRINGNNYYEYEKIKNLKVPDAGEKFSLDYKSEQFTAETKEKDDKDDAAKESGQDALQNGVRLEISSNGRLAGSGKAGKRISGTASKTKNINTLTNQASSLIESVRAFITTTIASIKDVFNKIWNEPQPENSVQESFEEKEQDSFNGLKPTKSVNDVDKRQPETIYGTPQEAAFAMQRNEALLDREIQPYLKNGDLNQVINLLTDNGRKTIARNSTLLTYYDKNGRMVEPNASDRERILHGDRNTRKL